MLLSSPGAGLLLDLDGTLLDSESVHRGAYHQYFAGRGWHVDDQVLAAFSGRRAAEVFSTLPGETQARSLSRAAGVRTKTMRAGEQLAEVGAHFIRS